MPHYRELSDIVFQLKHDGIVFIETEFDIVVEDHSEVPRRPSYIHDYSISYRITEIWATEIGKAAKMTPQSHPILFPILCDWAHDEQIKGALHEQHLEDYESAMEQRAERLRERDLD